MIYSINDIIMSTPYLSRMWRAQCIQVNEGNIILGSIQSKTVECGDGQSLQTTGS